MFSRFGPLIILYIKYIDPIQLCGCLYATLFIRCKSNSIRLYIIAVLMVLIPGVFRLDGFGRMRTSDTLAPLVDLYMYGSWVLNSAKT